MKRGARGDALLVRTFVDVNAFYLPFFAALAFALRRAAQ